ncbi:VWA domain-containing protein [Paenibacillus sp. IB182496]|uniref:VWA domain-containing protein n=1 Tax=Paenibacillus sabuli TaxID=2772509 RepID=A0A927GU20_9BACL|nr:VWA domain-containing protein [Paenibacillus sabuli]MBD2848459.1 VWA domain-containing protein [Paenibacillus sabuli]
MYKESRANWIEKSRAKRVEESRAGRTTKNRTGWFAKGKAAWLAAALLLMVAVVAGCSGGEGNNAQSTASDWSEGSAKREETSESSRSEATFDRAVEPYPGGGQQQQDQAAGQLTAGEWADTERWGEFLVRLNERDGAHGMQTWGITPLRRLAAVVTAAGEPVADAALVLRAGDEGETVWEGRTDNQGRAYVFAGIFEQQRGSNADAYTIEVRIGQDTVKRYANVALPAQEPLQIELDEAAVYPDRADIMLVVDTTGSMSDELDYLGAELTDVVQRAQERTGQELELRLSANFYRDEGDEYVVRSYPFTSKVSETVKQIREQRAEGGGDYPEAVDEALKDALHAHEWSEEARARLLFLVLDAPPHDDERTKQRIRELTSDAAALGVRIIPVASSGVDRETEYLMRFFAAATGGSYVFLTDHSGIGNSHLQPQVDQYEVRPLNDLLVELIVRYTERPQQG